MHIILVIVYGSFIIEYTKPRFSFSIAYPVRCNTTFIRVTSFASFLVPFPAILSFRWKSTCDLAMPKMSKFTKEETEQFTELVRENVALYDQSSDDLQHLFFLNRRPAMVSNELVP